MSLLATVTFVKFPTPSTLKFENGSTVLLCSFQDFRKFSGSFLCIFARIFLFFAIRIWKMLAWIWIHMSLMNIKLNIAVFLDVPFSDLKVFHKVSWSMVPSQLSGLLTPKRRAYDRGISLSIDTPFCNLIS
jgi:hypothetical protein